jgi:hypothetical protein
LLETGTIVSGYRIDGMLGEGGMGAVYRATQLSLNRTVALKVLATDLSEDETFRERFRREGLLQAAIDHAHIVTVYEAGETEEGLFLAMRLVRGPTLKDEILGKRLTPDRTARILTAVADALDAAHEVGLIHRDVKPQNILVGARDHAYLADFGLTHVPDEAGRLTGTGQFVGTIDYVSPEQLRGEGADHRSDVYALAGVLYECLSGEVPYPRPSEAAVLYAHLSDPAPSLSEKRPDLPAELDTLLARGMAKDPDERFSSAGEFMRSAAAALGVATAAPAPAAPAPGDGQATRPAGAAFGEQTVARQAVTAPAAAAPGAATTPAGEAVAERRAPAAAGVLIAGVLAFAAVGGFLIGGSGSDSGSDEPEFANSASAGGIELSFPADWERASGKPDLPGLELSDQMTLAPQGEGGSSLSAGSTTASGATLLPAGLLKRLPNEPEGEPVRLGETEALRYTDLRPRGYRDPVTLYAVPTNDGVATAVCSAATGAPSDFLPTCEQIAATLELSGVKPVPLGPSADYARAVGDALGPLNEARQSQGADLNEADTPAEQARAAQALARAYGVAAGAVGDAPAGPAESDANGAMMSALRQLEDAYGRLADAAEAGDSGSYTGASNDVSAAEKRLQRSLNELESLGYALS